MKDNEKDKKKNNPWESDENDYSELTIETQDSHDLSEKPEESHISTEKDDIWSELDLTENSQKENNKEIKKQNEKINIEKKDSNIKEDPWQAEEDNKEELILEIDEQPQIITENNAETSADDEYGNIIFEEDNNSELKENDIELQEKETEPAKSQNTKHDPWQAEEDNKEELILEIDEQPQIIIENNSEISADDEYENIIFEEDNNSELKENDIELQEKETEPAKSQNTKHDPWQTEEDNKEELILEIDEQPQIIIENNSEISDDDEYGNIIFEEDNNSESENISKKDDDMDFEELQEDILKSFSEIDFDKIDLTEEQNEEQSESLEQSEEKTYILQNDNIDKTDIESENNENDDKAVLKKLSSKFSKNKKIYLILIAISIFIILFTIIFALLKKDQKKSDSLSAIDIQIGRLGKRQSGEKNDIELKSQTKKAEEENKKIQNVKESQQQVIAEPKPEPEKKQIQENKKVEVKIIQPEKEIISQKNIYEYTIDSQPQGVKVIVDRKYFALTPFSGKSDTKEISVTLEHKFFETEELKIDVSKESYKKIKMDKRKTGTLKIKTYPPALISINNGKWEESPYSKTLPFDNYRIEIKKEGYTGIVENIEFAEEDKVIEYNPEILPPLGKIEVEITDIYSRGGEFRWNEILNTEKYIVFIDNAEYAEVSEPFISISDLSPDTDYNISVIAQNKGGRSASTVKKRFRTFRRPGETKSIEIFPGIQLDMIFVTPGVFQMGGSDGLFFQTNEVPQHTVKISRGFYISKYEITQRQFEKVTGYNPSKFKDPDFPVESIKWEQAVEFCNALSWSKKLKERYVLNENNIDVDYNADGFRLPTEAEWEYCYRAGTSTRFYWGDKEDTDYYQGFTQTNGKPAKPGQKKPNNWGIYDMAGNVWEWCEDFYSGSFYEESPEIDPVFNKMRSYRVIRGGSCNDDTDFMRGSNRGMYGMYVEPHTQGFRVIIPE